MNVVKSVDSQSNAWLGEANENRTHTTVTVRQTFFFGHIMRRNVHSLPISLWTIPEFIMFYSCPILLFKKKITSMMLHVMVYFWHQWRIDHICPLSLQCQPITSYFQSIPPLQHISTVINYSERTNNSHLLLSSISMSHYVKHSFTENISVHTFMISQKLVHIFGQDTESCASTVTVLFF